MNVIFVSEQANKALIDYLETLGTVILIPQDERFDKRIGSHPDLIISIIDDTLIIDELAHRSIFSQLDALGIPYLLGSSRLGAIYPEDIAYNAVITKEYILHNFDHTNSLLLQHCRNTNKSMLPVKQGYTKCSTVVIDDQHLITGDMGIYQAAKDYMNVLLVQSGHVVLDGYDYGFLGGSSGVIRDTVLFHGDLSAHPDYLQIKSFIEAAGKLVLYFPDYPLTDIGSILVYPIKKAKQEDNPKVHQKHVNIPIFISHEGCPNDCVFCNQRKITAKATAMTLEEVSEQIEIYCSTLDHQTYRELAFFGGSFTGIASSLQENYLKLASEYKKSGRIQAIRLSTRPDYITKDILDRLRFYGVDIIELGVQSLDEDVLKASKRGHLISDVYQAVELIKSYGFQLGIQLMVGLPEDTKERTLLSAKLTALLQPEFVRIYPTLVIRETELSELSCQGIYHPLSLEEAVDWTKEMYQVFIGSQIPVIRMGLQPTELIAEGKEVLYGPFHPAFRQLVESRYFYDKIIRYLNLHANNLKNCANIKIICNPRDLSQVIGHNRRNVLELNKEYPQLHVMADASLRSMALEIQLL